MGEVQMIRGFGERWVRNPKSRAIVLGCALGALLFAACSGKKAPTTAAAAPATRETVASAVQSAPPAQITGMELREGAPGLRLDWPPASGACGT